MNPDYSLYDLAQLRQVLATIDAKSFPDRAAEVRACIAELEQAPPEPEPATVAPGPEQITLRHAANVLRIVGLLDVIFAVASYVLLPQNGIYISLGMLLGAAMLWSGKLRAASIVRWVACAYLPIALVWAAGLVLSPPDLNLSYLRLYPVQMLAVAGLGACHWLVALWLVRTLGLPPILAARSAAGKRVRDMRIPLVLGALGAVFSIFLMAKMLGGERAHRAETMAQQAVGKGYRVWTESLNVTTTKPFGTSEDTTFVNASVAAWNDAAVVHVPVHWREN